MSAAPAPPTAPPKPTWDPKQLEPPYPWLRPTIRIRLTLLYGGMFLIAGILLLSIIYMLAAQALHVGSELPFKIVSGQVSSDVCNLSGEGSSPSAVNAAMNSCVNHQRQQALDTLLNRSLLALVGLSVIAFAFGYAMAGRVLSPLGRITRTARQVAGTDLSRRIELDGPDDELKELADTFDDMLDRLERAFTAQQRFVGNASHELRTPLAINRTLLEVHLSDPQAPPGSSSSARPCWPPTSAASSWSRACCCSPGATTRSSSASRSTWPKSPPGRSTRREARPRRRAWSSAGRSCPPSSRATVCCWSGSR